MTYEIIDNIQFPKQTRQVLKPAKYPFAMLGEGQGFKEAVPADSTPAKVSARLLSAVYSFRKSFGEDAPKFEVRQLVESDGSIVVAVRRKTSAEVAIEVLTPEADVEVQSETTTSPQEYY